eukprot:TRINITY_DN40077_c0_g1_i1.p1 TRINITY_DN40077_c0_g1~~TRINITY_DN40077_c0_g1_i1.p1  ORF type:complete len:502 (+),score=133.11 TRINITY_DN40077_c0_g1_i1:65-1570(+)
MCSKGLVGFGDRPSLAKGMHRPGCLVPTLLKQPPADPSKEDSVRFKPLCATILAATLAPEWDGRWALSQKEADSLFRLIDTSSPRGRQGKDLGTLDLEDLTSFADDPRSRAKVTDTYPGSVHGIVNSTLVASAFEEFDVDGNKKLDKSEWGEFLERLKEHRIKYLQREAFLHDVLFFGRGKHPWQHKVTRAKADEDDDDRIDIQAAQDIARNLPGFEDAHSASGGKYAKLEGTSFGSGFQGLDPDLWDHDGHRQGCCCFPPGYWGDFLYFSANNHPIHAIFSCDPNHRLNKSDRVILEFTTIFFAFFMTELRHEWVTEQQAPLDFLTNPTLFGLCIVTVPSMVLFKVLTMLFTCPCGNWDASTESPDVVSRKRNLSLIAALTGWLIILALTVFFVLHLVSLFQTIHACHHATVSSADCDATLTRYDRNRLTVFLSRLQAYAMFWLVAFCTTFNPFFAFGSWSDPKHIGNMIGIGKWRLQKQVFKRKCHDISVAKKGGYGGV